MGTSKSRDGEFLGMPSFMLSRGVFMAKKSDNATKGSAKAPHRSLFYAMGYTDEELERPLVGVCCAKNEIIPGHIEPPWGTRA